MSDKLSLTKKQIKLVNLMEKCGYLREHEIVESEYPKSLVSALIDKGVIARVIGTDKLISMVG